MRAFTVLSPNFMVCRLQTLNGTTEPELKITDVRKLSATTETDSYLAHHIKRIAVGKSPQ
ncbi:hypothetical protein VZ94_12770 [Methylocucumis oryzae]|uniref:Uncharacterized protein n=1 Tax=Methylocucumis oryzae TaxID=1632867 RepID=A0A0F3II48_9GAMM|nr:hypothetical protein VZ94_12770 [Methylocucumis oryzae]